MSANPPQRHRGEVAEERDGSLGLPGREGYGWVNSGRMSLLKLAMMAILSVPYCRRVGGLATRRASPNADYHRKRVCTVQAGSARLERR
jgi:hypothetical protein